MRGVLSNGCVYSTSEHGKVSLRELEELCTREDMPELYVPKFRNNFAQMKIDGAKTYGKVF